MNFTLLIYAIGAVVLGPVFYQLAYRYRSLVSFIDGFIFISIGGLLLLHTLDISQDHLSISIMLIMLAGFLGPNLIESVLIKREKQVHSAVLILGFIGLLLHELIDGATLFSSQSKLPLQLAILLHRAPVGLAVWWLLRPKFGFKISTLAIISMCLATTLGFISGFELSDNLLFINYLQAFAAVLYYMSFFFVFIFTNIMIINNTHMSVMTQNVRNQNKLLS